MLDRELGKIHRIDFHRKGGVYYELGGKGWGVNFSETTDQLDEKLLALGKEFARDLENLPVEVFFLGGVIKSWRVLEECL